MPCEWDGTDIVIMNNVRVTDPYRQEDCSCKPGQEAARDRIRLIVRGLCVPALRGVVGATAPLTLGSCCLPQVGHVLSSLGSA